MKQFIVPLSNVSLADIAKVGGKNASLGEMINTLKSAGIRVPQGFATTSEAFWYFIDANELREKIAALLEELDRKEFSNLADVAKDIRQLLLNAKMPADLGEAISKNYRQLSANRNISVAIRSSATAEDLPNASFAGQHDSFLNISGAADVLVHVQRCFSSLYTDRAIKYREDNHFPHEKVALSAGIQEMVRSDKACSGVGFTIEPESGFRNIIHLSGVWGLGENIVQGTVTPDEFFVFKPTLLQGKNPIVQKKLGAKENMLIYSTEKGAVTTLNIPVPEEKRETYVLNDTEIITLAKWAIAIEKHYKTPMDIEWAKDGETGQLYIIQARPETVHSRNDVSVIHEYRLQKKGNLLSKGLAVGANIASGRARVLHSVADARSLEHGDVVVTGVTSPDWDPFLKKASAIVTDRGGRTSHASIVARELGVPAVVATLSATRQIRDGDMITVSCAEGKTGYVYQGALPFEKTDVRVESIRLPETTDAMLIMADPDKAFQLSFYPNHGVGLLRMEFIIANWIGVHPMSLVKFNEVRDEAVKQSLTKLIKGYATPETYFIERLAQGIASIAAAFYPKDVIVRMSDFKSNEYANLTGGQQFEPREENPMIGFRGASRYYSDLYKDGFGLECKAMKMVRNEMGLTNVKLMIPFCRTVEEGKKVIEVMKEFGLDRSTDETLEIYVMAEIPSNVLQAEEFAQIFDGFSIGSNDLTQLTLGIDRDSSLVADLFDENNTSALAMVETMIDKAKHAGSKIGLCGQAPSDYPAYAGFLVRHGIDSISFNADALLKGIENICHAEAEALQQH